MQSNRSTYTNERPAIVLFVKFSACYCSTLSNELTLKKQKDTKRKVQVKSTQNSTCFAKFFNFAKQVFQEIPPPPNKKSAVFD